MAAGHWKESDLLDFWPEMNLNWLDQELAGNNNNRNGSLPHGVVEAEGGSGSGGSPGVDGGSNKVTSFRDPAKWGITFYEGVQHCLSWEAAPWMY